MKKCQCCLEGGGGNHGCGNGNGSPAPICTRYNTTLYGKSMCNQHGGSQNDSIVSIFLQIVLTYWKTPLLVTGIG
jgi:hypothetical protein